MAHSEVFQNNLNVLYSTCEFDKKNKRERIFREGGIHIRSLRLKKFKKKNKKFILFCKIAALWYIGIYSTTYLSGTTNASFSDRDDVTTAINAGVWEVEKEKCPDGKEKDSEKGCEDNPTKEDKKEIEKTPIEEVDQPNQETKPNHEEPEKDQKGKPKEEQKPAEPEKPKSGSEEGKKEETINKEQEKEREEPKQPEEQVPAESKPAVPASNDSKSDTKEAKIHSSSQDSVTTKE